MSIKIDTLLAQGGNGSDDIKTGAVVSPLYFSTAYRHPNLGESSGFDYARLQTPTRQILEEQLADLEQGVQAFATSSGMAAIDLLFASLIKNGDHFVTSDDLYGGTYRYFDAIVEQSGVSYDVWNGVDDISTLINETTRLVWLETPSNPTMKVIDIQKLSAKVKGINPDILIVVDNTFLTPIFQQPLTLGADIVVHSATKYLGGHNDILAGAVIVNSDDLAEKLEISLTTRGQVLDSFSSWLLLRSLKTLHLRMQRHNENGQYLAKKLPCIPGIDKVLYAGVGGMLSFYLSNDYDVDAFLKGLQIGSFAESLGGPETLITIPAVQTHHDMSQEQRDHLGITNQLVRVSAGLEGKEDLLADLRQAVEGAKR
ncbi:trans-sulfuration enzyme family protein [Leuconostoc mesenteroides]|uniref:trans-sulfuration enzyme family protein n=1 Tax=Leuconostoc mesenteroides TaxID=1245 RepID=UPI001CBCBF62|nr:aminotransferase class I/II-fold pyridoxal phosphate-dependent enzyme [Leuconostoc mesenteroides]MBZ1514788.1 aminotransferase class I/II-fold pyridoxal phosphate-dependent enzyme [Leuconostoc mesenteroides]